MNALRTLPILNRPSRPASPAPPTVQSTTASAQPPSTEKPRSRSLSRQVADKVSSLQISTNGTTVQPPAVTLSQPLAKRPSPPGSRTSSPRSTASPFPAATPGEQTPSGGYMDVIGLRLNETVNKASAGVDFKTKKGFKKGSGFAIGEAVVKELPSPPSDAYLMRAVLRISVRALSIYVTRLESLLLPSLTDASFIAPLNISTSTAHPLNPVQYFALSVAHTAWETCEILEQTLETAQWPRFVQETLRPVMDKLDLVVSKVVQPLLLGLKRDLITSLTRTEGTSPPGGKTIGLASIPAPATSTNGIPVTKEGSHQPVSRLTKEFSSGGHARQLAIPPCLQHFAARVDGSRKVFELIAKPCADDGEGWVTGVVVAVIWKGMCVISDKDLTAAGARPPSPNSVARALAGLGKERDSAPSIAPSPSLQGVTAKLASSLSIVPTRSQSRASSPPRQADKLDPVTQALLSLEGLIKRLVSGFVQPPSPADDEDEHLARQALSEALEALQSFRIVSTAMNRGLAPSARLLASARRLRDDVEDPAEDELDDAMEDLQAVILFSILSRQANQILLSLPVSSDKEPILKIRHPSEVWAWQMAEYERQVLSGFSTAEEWGRRVAVALKGDIEKILTRLAGIAARQGMPEKASKEKDIVGEAVEWVKLLGVACDAKCGLKVGGAA
ncbi:hypothetical protein I314_05002 [Cryptococcus bacillisporus CA1873]|uniref:Uncharacterized protein n=1 Tax=Cryptococcus bacillisporus CA1873 TaxID=1296111 RepID=A0ABR5B626_CRYGA|nr:hypothetical protein I314_05002 [Cryptococcus bacillisporus CA1873]|eukprot:KIR59018.1 hypothetical protein I314_05002 [Cryptococcus gattii CA1873]